MKKEVAKSNWVKKCTFIWQGFIFTPIFKGSCQFYSWNLWCDIESFQWTILATKLGFCENFIVILELLYQNKYLSDFQSCLS